MRHIEAVEYEWDVETVVQYADDEEDIIDHDHRRSAAECLARLRAPFQTVHNGENVTEITRMVLVCDVFDGSPLGSDRGWAYVDNGALDTHFVDAAGHNLRKVPKRFHDELARASAARAK